MPIIEALHQFEIRFTPIFEFNNLSKKIVAPYLSRTSAVNVENENSFREKITLSFDNDTYIISLSWDRFIFTTTADINSLSQKNSIIEEPFFSIFNKIILLKEFDIVRNCLLYTLTINNELTYTKENFAKDFLRDDLNITPHTDCAITLDNIVDQNSINLTFGPYIGIEDVRKRGIVIPFNKQNELKDAGGIISDLKILKTLNNVTFNNYQSISAESISTIKKIWQRI